FGTQSEPPRRRRIQDGYASSHSAGVPAQLLAEPRRRPRRAARIVPGPVASRAGTLRCDRTGAFSGVGGRGLPDLFGPTAGCHRCAGGDDRAGTVARGTRTGERESTGRRAGTGTVD